MDIVDRIFELVDAKYNEQREFAAALEIDPTIPSRWKKRKSTSYQKYLSQIAEVLGTTTDYLNYGIRPDSEHLTDDERRLLTAYRQADEKSRAMVRLALNLDSAAPPVSAPSEKAM